MDIHPPEHPIRSIGDFALQIFTITCGILIALGLEQIVEWRRGEALAAHARAEFRIEIAENRRRLSEVLAQEPAIEQGVADLLAFTKARLDHTPPPKVMHNLPERRNFLRLTSDAWDSAMATQATLHLTFGETRALLTAYAEQRTLNEISSRAIERWVDLSAFADIETMPEADLRRVNELLRITLAYAGSVAGGSKRLLEAYSGAEAALGK